MLNDKILKEVKLSEDTRLSTVILHCFDGIYDQHEYEDTYFITEHGKENNILMVITKDLWNKVFEK